MRKAPEGVFAFWSDGYFSESVGRTEEQMVRRYIQNQGRAKPEAEE